MSYDLRGAWEAVTGHHTTTRPHPEDDADTQLLTVVSKKIKLISKCRLLTRRLTVTLVFVSKVNATLSNA